MEIRIVPAYGEADKVRTLFTEYTDMLVAGDPAFAGYLQVQHYDAELADLEEKYGLPYGRLYLAETPSGEPAGCVGLKRLDAARCELKRLYVRPAFRGQHLAGRLMAQVLADARAVGYRTMLLDTLPFLHSALRLYRKLGFVETGCYNNSPMSTSIYMEKDLTTQEGESK